MTLDICQNCRKRPATMDWIGDGGVFAITHGLSQRWCDHCAVFAQLDYAEKIVATLPKLFARCLELAAVPDPQESR